MKTLSILFFLVIATSFKTFTPSATNDCNNCSLLTVVNISGTGFTPGKRIGVQAVWPNGFSQNFMATAYPNIIVPQSGNIEFSFGLTSQIGEYEINIYELKNAMHWVYKATTTFTVQ